MRAWPTLLVAALLTLTACGEPPTPPPDGCSQALGGAAFEDSSLPESEPGLEALLAGAQAVSLPAQIPTDGLDALSLMLLSYSLEQPQTAITPELDAAQIDQLHSGLRDGIALSLAGGALDVPLLRRVLHRYYACERSLPRTLDELRLDYGDYRELPSRSISQSVPKRAPRTFYEDPEGGIYVAENEGPSGGMETEVILEGHRADGALDFLTYDEGGRLVDRAPLAMGSSVTPLPAPFSCMMCHRDLTTNQVDVVDPGQ